MPQLHLPLCPGEAQARPRHWFQAWRRSPSGETPGFLWQRQGGPPSQPLAQLLAYLWSTRKVVIWVSGLCLRLSWSLPPGEYLVVGEGGNASKADGVGHRQARRVAWPSHLPHMWLGAD